MAVIGDLVLGNNSKERLSSHVFAEYKIIEEVLGILPPPPIFSRHSHGVTTVLNYKQRTNKNTYIVLVTQI